MAATWVDALLDFLYPPSCPGCGGPGPATSLCVACRGRCARVPPSAAWIASSSERPARWAALRYSGPVRDLLCRAKYGKDPSPLPALAEFIERHLPRDSRLLGADFVVPVPITRARRRERGFNQVAWLARAVGRRLDRPVAWDALARVRPGPAQVELRGRDRRRTIAGSMRGRAVGQRRIVLVDDVETTGATLGEGRRALFAADAREVTGVTLCRVAISGELA